MPERRAFVTYEPEGSSVGSRSSCAICRVGFIRSGVGLRASRPEIAVLDDETVAPAVASEVVVWSDDHNVTLADLSGERLGRLIEVWAERFAELSARAEFRCVVIVAEVRIPAASTDHPHAAIHGYREIPPRVARDLGVARQYMDRHGRCLRCDVGAHTAAAEHRVVAADARMLAFVPFPAQFPYEVHVQPLRHATSLLDLSDKERGSLAGVLHQVLSYERLSDHSMPYAVALHQAPTDDGDSLDVSHLCIELTSSVGRGMTMA